MEGNLGHENDRLVHRNRYDVDGCLETNVTHGFTLVAVGDLIVTRPLTKGHHPGFSEIVEILRNADVTFGNMETNILDIRSFTGSPQAEHGGAYHVSLPDLAPDLKSMGFNMVSYANNHTFEWGVEGMRETCRALDQNGIVYAGVGENLAQASAARFLETPGGRVALVSCASTFTPMSRACDPAGAAPGRPGLNPLRVEEYIVVPPAMFESLRQVRDALPNYGSGQSDPNRLGLAGATYKIGDQPGYSYLPNPADVADILRNTRQGKQFADFCIVTNHGHEPGNWSQQPPDYVQSFARQTIDAGADAYIVHGPHQLRGIEIYRGRPIFYSVGNFIMDDLRTPVGADMFTAYGKDPRTDTDAEVTLAEMAQGYESDAGFTDPIFYESVVAVNRFEDNRLAELRLYPIELGHSERFANRGVPRLARGQQGRAILQRIQDLSEVYGTEIVVEDDIGVITFERSARRTEST
ncbi:CapA family protein [Sinorhizobium medicae]|uniref:CapA family protein n=1 Tax=Sinorhizobium medicae TaxID=110321 RepID=UPI000FDBF9A0|nr:CapA family protein [Sinorhizobium medicae]RVP45354.1 CapA family protein [Sinorhizobium medicae]RVP68224.1 CapA family protein [Sinorhizobium medicae]UWU12544.1 CapA family protein [Sinorhizobium medicae]